jgi:PST family polysaccharide transporter/lipopolysaccharide exporter
VLFPSLSQFQDDLPRLRESFFRSVQVTTLFSFPAALGIAVIAPTFVRAFLGPAWLPMVPVMQLLAGLGFLRSFTVTFGPVWKAIGRPDYETKITFVRVTVLAIGIYPATTAFGIEGAAAVVLGAFIALLPPSIHLIVRSLETTYARLARELSYPVVASAAMVVSVGTLDRLFTLGWPLLDFLLLVAAGIVSYAASVAVLTLTFSWGVDSNLRLIVDALQN